ncbi:MAG: MBL fold metallo-hydrolase, partial [Epsilonproteobacteria bacterium]|nr:MBL fold metallo-hydrolase [Campylobacterota bacterium]
IHTINGFSAHADQKDILNWVSKIDGLKMICLIHGEKDKQEVLQKALEEKLEKKVHIVEPEEKIYL